MVIAIVLETSLGVFQDMVERAFLERQQTPVFLESSRP